MCSTKNASFAHEITEDQLVPALTKYTITKSLEFLKADPRQYYIYGCPPEYVDDPRYDRDEHKKRQRWPSIRDFQYPEILTSIRDYIKLWKFKTNYTVSIITKEGTEKTERFGKCYKIVAYFMKSTLRCPSPKIRAAVYFYVHVSSVLPSYYPIMVTYSFEGDEREYYCSGNNMVTNVKFQYKIIDKILTLKYRTQSGFGDTASANLEASSIAVANPNDNDTNANQ